MKRLLSLLAVMGLAATTSVTVVACNSNSNQKTIDLSTIEFSDLQLALPADNQYTQSQLDDVNNNLQNNISAQINANTQQDFGNDFTTNFKALVQPGVEITPGTQFQITITANNGSSILEGTNVINVILDNMSLEDAIVIENNQLGFFDNEPTPEEILDRINDGRNETGLIFNTQDITVGNPENNQVPISAGPNGIYSGMVVLNYEVSEDLTTVIPNTNLGYFTTDPTSTQVLDKVNELNDGLNLSEDEVIISTATGGEVSITAKPETRFKNSVELSYAISQSLPSAITIKNLGFFAANPTEEEVLTAVNDLNPNLALEASEVEIGIATNNKVTIDAKPGTRFQGSAELTYAISQPLFDAIENVEIGYFDEIPTPEEILDRINSENNGLNLLSTEVTIGTPIDGEVVVTAKPGTRFRGSVDIFYDLRRELSEAVTNTALGSFVDEPTLSDVVSRILDMNPNSGVTIDSITINTPADGEVTAIAVPDGPFKGFVVLTYTIAD